MKIITPGYRYELAYFETASPTDQPQVIQFIEKEKDELLQLKTVRNGTTNEEVLAVLIDRLQVLSAKLPSRETSIAITKCEEALMWLHKRTSERKARGVEGTPNP